MSIEISGTTPSLNTTVGSKSYLILRGNGFEKDQPVAVWYPVESPTTVWSGTVLIAARNGRFALVKLTSQGAISNAPVQVPADGSEVSVTVDGTQSKVTADIYAE